VGCEEARRYRLSRGNFLEGERFMSARESQGAIGLRRL